MAKIRSKAHIRYKHIVFWGGGFAWVRVSLVKYVNRFSSALLLLTLFGSILLVLISLLLLILSTISPKTRVGLRLILTTARLGGEPRFLATLSPAVAFSISFSQRRSHARLFINLLRVDSELDSKYGINLVQKTRCSLHRLLFHPPGGNVCRGYVPVLPAIVPTRVDDPTEVLLY
jgi:hypothetical protein